MTLKWHSAQLRTKNPPLDELSTTYISKCRNTASSSLPSDKTLALSHHHCGGNVSLGREPAGHIDLTSPGLLTDADRLEPVDDHSDETLRVSVCTWVIDIPLGRTVLLKFESGSNISVRCFWSEEDQVLETGGTFLLSGCDGNRASLIWTGAGHTSNAVQLSYYGEKLNYPL